MAILPNFGVATFIPGAPIDNPCSKTMTQGNELRTAFRRCAGALLSVGIFSGVINVLGLTGSLYMLQVYDRVLPSQ